MATTGDLTVALVIRADAAQARAELALTQAQLKGVEDAAKAGGVGFAAYSANLQDIMSAQRDAAVAAGATSDAVADLSKAYTTASTASASVGETAEQQAARLHAVVAASRAVTAAEDERAAAEAGAAKGASATADAAAAQSRSWQEVVAAQNAATNAYHAARAPLAELDAAMARTSITTEESERLEAALTVAHRKGAITDAEFADAINTLADAKIKDAAATEAQVVAQKEANAASGFKMNSRMGYSATALVSDIASGQFSRSKREVAALANESGLFAKLLSPVGLMIGGVVAALGTLAVAFAKGEAESASFSNALILTGGYAGKSAAQLQALAIQLDQLTGTSEHAAASVVAQVAATGKFYGDQVQMVATAALQMQQAIGQSVATTIKQFEALGQDPVAGVLKLNDSMHFLTQAAYDQITALVQEGEQDQAVAVAQQSWAAAVAQRTAEVRQNVGLLESAWNGLKSAVKDAWSAMMDVGRSDAGANLAMWQRQLAAARANLATPGLDDKAIFAFMQQANQAQAEIYKLSGKTAADAKKVSDALTAQHELAAGGLTAFQQYMQAVAHYTALYKKAIVDASAEAQAAAKSALDVHLAKAEKTYESASKQPKVHGVSGLSIDRAQLTADVSAVQDQLRTLSTAWQNTQRVLASQHRAGALSDKQYFDALRKDLDQYTQERIAALEQEKKAAQGHIATQADRIRADQKVASIDAEISQARQSAAAKREEINAQEKKSVEELTRAWQKLQAEVGKDQGAVDFGAFGQKVGTAKAALGAGLTDQQGYQSTVDALIMQTVKGNGGPQYQGLSPQVGGAFSDLGRAQAGEQRENAYFQQELVRLTQFYDKKKITTEKYDADLENIVADHQKKLTKIESDEQLARYKGLASAFDEVSRAMSQAFGAQSTAARITFDISKAAAIAESTVAMFKAQAKVSAEVPYPANIAAEAAAIADGMSIIADIRAIQVEGFSAGGYTGPGARTDVAGVVHAGEGVLSAPEVASLGGESGFNALRASLRNGFADGGYVKPFADAPTPAQLGFATPTALNVNFAKLAAANESRASAPMGVRIVNSIDPGFATDAMNSPAGEKVIMNTIARNQTKIKQMVR